MEAKTHITILKSPQDIVKFRDAWKQWQLYPNSDIDFYLHVIKARNEAVTPYVIVIESENQPIAIAIGRKETGFIDLKAGYKSLFRVKANIIVIMHNGFIGTTDYQASQLLVEELKHCLRQGVADVVHFELLASHSILLKTLQAKTSVFFRDPIIEYRDHWTMTIPKTVSCLYDRLSSNHRNQLRRLSKKLERDFPGTALQIRCFQKQEELDNLFSDVEIIAKQTYQRGLGAGFIDNLENRSRLTLEASNNWLRMNVLYINEEPSAYWWGIVYKNIFYSCALGYVPKYQNYSIGMYLLIKTFETLCGQHYSHVDFGPGDARYKQQFGDQSYEEASINLFAPTLKAITLNMALTINNAIIHYLKIALNRFKIIDTLKKHWRNKLKTPASV